MSGMPVTEQSLPPGADPLVDVQRVEQRFQYANPSISAATTTVVKIGPGFVREIRAVGGTLGAVTVYDNTAASGTALLCPTATPLQNGVLCRDVEFFTGLTILTAAATILTVSYR